MSEQPGRKQVILRTSLEINGRKVQGRAAVDLQAWNDSPEIQAHAKDWVRRDLAEAIVKELNPEVLVEMPPPTLSESLAEALRPFDYPYGELGL